MTRLAANLTFTAAMTAAALAYAAYKQLRPDQRPVEYLEGVYETCPACKGEAELCMLCFDLGAIPHECCYIAI